MQEETDNYSPLNFLKEFAQTTNRQFFAEEYQISTRYGHTKRTIAISDEHTNTCLLWYSDPSNLSDFSMFSGAAFPSHFSENCQLMVEKTPYGQNCSLLVAIKDISLKITL